MYDLNEWTGCKRHENTGCIKSKVQMRKRARWTEYNGERYIDKWTKSSLGDNGRAPSVMPAEAREEPIHQMK